MRKIELKFIWLEDGEEQNDLDYIISLIGNRFTVLNSFPDVFHNGYIFIKSAESLEEINNFFNSDKRFSNFAGSRIVNKI